MRKLLITFVLPALIAVAMTGCSDKGNRVPEPGMAKKYVEENPDAVAAQKKADEESEKQND